MRVCVSGTECFFFQKCHMSLVTCQNHQHHGGGRSRRREMRVKAFCQRMMQMMTVQLQHAPPVFKMKCRTRGAFVLFCMCRGGIPVPGVIWSVCQ